MIPTDIDNPVILRTVLEDIERKVFGNRETGIPLISRMPAGGDAEAKINELVDRVNKLITYINKEGL